jgi:hypothetical protein
MEKLDKPFEAKMARFLRQGCQIFLGSAYQKGKNVPNDSKNILMAVK